MKSRTGYPKVRGDCPFSHRALLTITLKKIPHQVKLIDLKNKPAWFVDAFPKAEVPVVHFPEGRKEGPEWVSGSDTICDVLEKEYPEPSLRLAQGKEAEVGSKIFGSFVKFVTNADPGKEAELKDALLAEIKSLDAYLRENEVRSEPTMSIPLSRNIRDIGSSEERVLASTPIVLSFD